MADPEKDENYQKQYKIFMTKLFKFHEQNGTPIKRLPLLGGKELDLYHLYQKVQSLGGSEQVTRNRQWGEVARSFNLPPSVTSASYAIRQHFVKLLERYEQLENDLVYGPASTSGAALLQLGTSVPTFHTTQPSPSLSSVTIPTPAPIVDMSLLKYDRLVRSLTSGFPNEVDFAFNVLVILSHEKSLPIEKLPHLLDLMLAHVGIFSEDDQELEGLHYETWHKDQEMDFTQFWGKTAPWCVLAAVFTTPSGGVNDEDGMLFNHMSHETPEAFRITQLMNVILNLSFESPCAQALGEHEGLRRLVLLCINNIIPPIQTVAFDVLANISSYMLVPHEGDGGSVESLLVASVHQSILCPDKHSVIRGLEVLAGLAWCLDNEAALLTIPPEVYQHMLRLLLIPDCELMLASLETLYTLSMYSADVAERIAGVSGCVTMMVTMATTEVGEDAVQHVKVISSSEGDAGGAQAHPLSEAIPIAPPVHQAQPRTSMAVTPLVTPTTAGAVQPSPNSLLLALLPKPGLSAEAFTRQWLQTCYEGAPGECVQQMELYANYLIYCSQVGQSSVLTSNDFTLLVKKIFPNSLSARVTVGTQGVLVIAGLRKRRLPVLPSKSSVPSSSSVTSTVRPLQPQATLRNVSAASPLVVASKALGGVSLPNHVTLPTHNQGAKPVGASVPVQSNHVTPSVGQKVPLVQEKCQGGSVPNPTSDSVSNSTLESKAECEAHSGTVLTDEVNENKENDRLNPVLEPAQKKLKPDEQNSGLLMHTCHWDSCTFSADSRTGLFCHVVFTHISSIPSFPSPCLWSQCTSTAKRTKSSLITHVKVHHCKLYPPGHTNHYVPSVTNTLAKLKSLPPFEVKEESPPTKAVRLTSALILRNLVKLVPSVRRDLQKHELWLSEAALSDCEASTALAQCLSWLSS